MLRKELCAYLDATLEAGRFRDYCPNGLQVEGRPEVRRILCGVTASQALLDAAVAQEADAVLVHHGWFWKGEDSRVLGLRKQRLATLLRHDINLIAYHLPLDAHGGLGNNAQLAKVAGWQTEGRFAEQDIGFYGRPANGLQTAEAIAQTLQQVLGRHTLLVGDGEREVRCIAWCSGGAQGYFEQAIATGADLFVSGEISEQTTHLARESGIPYIAAGHHATERYGIQALAKHLETNLGLTCPYVEVDNPV